MHKKLSFFLALVLIITFLTCGGAQASSIVLEKGCYGSDVTKVQKKLITWGYLSGSADGIYGTDTVNAVKKFQRNNGLTADGKVGSSTAAKMGVTLSGNFYSTSTASTATIVSSNHRLLAKLVYAEAKGETYRGQVAVAAVVLNRVRSSSFPNTISGVIYQSGAFDCVSNGSINSTPNNSAIRAAMDALNGWDPTGGCLYYWNSGLSNSWTNSLTVKTVIGNHSFAA